VTTLDSLAVDAIALVGDKPRAILGIAGSPGVGKSTIVDRLLVRIRAVMGEQWAAHVPMDGFHLADVQLERLGLRDRKGAPETFDAAGYANLLKRVVQELETPVYVPGFDRTLEQPLAGALVVLPAARLVITEGNYLLLDEPAWVRARRVMAAVWFVAGAERVRVQRLVDRHVEYGKSPQAAKAWVAEIDQPNADLVSTTAINADRIVVQDAGGLIVNG
jgi:pantothenate kinase